MKVVHSKYKCYRWEMSCSQVRVSLVWCFAELLVIIGLKFWPSRQLYLSHLLSLVEKFCCYSNFMEICNDVYIASHVFLQGDTFHTNLQTKLQTNTDHYESCWNQSSYNLGVNITHSSRVWVCHLYHIVKGRHRVMFGYADIERLGMLSFQNGDMCRELQFVGHVWTGKHHTSVEVCQQFA